MDGFVLCGGLSRRMGSDKARLPLRGRPAALAMADLLREAGCARVSLVCKGDAYTDLGLPLVQDGTLAGHPLVGVAAALEASTSALLLVCPIDLVALRPADVRLLLDQGGPCVAASEAGVEPLLAVLAKDQAQRALELAAQGQSARAFVDSLPRVLLPARAMRNANHRDEWRDDVDP